jgi:hypothetical protein
MVSVPLFLVSSWWVYERLVLGKEQKRIEPKVVGDGEGKGAATGTEGGG